MPRGLIYNNNFKKKRGKGKWGNAYLCMLCWQLEITHWYVGTFAGEGAYRLIEDFDDDGDGVLNKNEFVNFMASLQRDAGNDVYLSLQALQRHKCVVV